MNAYELADNLDKFASQEPYPLLFQKSANMLRNQAEEINNLKQWQTRMLDVIKNLESQVYGGTTK